MVNLTTNSGDDATEYQRKCAPYAIADAAAIAKYVVG
jgi:hypothetical protein